MLQISILHEKNKIKVLEIKSVDTLTVLSTFDESTGKIDLEPLKDHIGEKAMISHFNKENDCTMFDYEHVKTITKVDTDENGIWFFEYN